MGSSEVGIVDCRDLTSGEAADRVPNPGLMEIEHNEFIVPVRGKRLDADVLVPVLLGVVGQGVELRTRVRKVSAMGIDDRRSE